MTTILELIGPCYTSLIASFFKAFFSFQISTEDFGQSIEALKPTSRKTLVKGDYLGECQSCTYNFHCVWFCGYLSVVNSLDGQFSPPFAPPTSPPTFPSPPPPSTPNICFLVLTCLAHLFFLTLHPHTAQSTSSWLYTFFFSFISSLCSAWCFCHNSLTFSALFPAHFSLWARHPLQVAFPPRNISNPLCPLHFQHCFFSTSSTTISPHAIPCFVVFKCFPPLLFLIWQSHTSQ